MDVLRDPVERLRFRIDGEEVGNRFAIRTTSEVCIGAIPFVLLERGPARLLVTSNSPGPTLFHLVAR